MTTLRVRLTAAAVSTALLIAGLIGFDAAARATAPACGNTSLTATRGLIDGALGHGGVTLFFRNSSRHTCSLRGYPGVDELDMNGQIIAHATRTLRGYLGGASSVHTVKLAPGGFASALVEWINTTPIDGHNCAQAAYLRATPANTSHAVRMPTESTTNCFVQVHPTVGGTSGNFYFAHAQQAWLQGAIVPFPGNGGYWQHARTLLLRAHFSSYGDASKALTQLILLPDAYRTTKEIAAYRADIELVNAFFTTPKLYA